jgi:hypothetical protein
VRTRLLAGAVAATVALAIALGFGPHTRSLALAAYLDFLCALVVIGLAATIRSTFPPAPDPPRRRHRRRPEPRPPEQVDWVERQLGFARSSGRELHVYFRPLVAQIAAALLAREHGIGAGREPEWPRELVGEHVSELIRQDRPEPDRHAPGLSLQELRQLVDELEAIA